MKMITIAGNVGKDAEVKRTQDGDPMAVWSVAVSGRNQETTWFDCTMFGKRGSSIAQYIKKGDKITVIGDLQTREHEGRFYLQVRVSDVTLQGQKQSDQKSTAQKTFEPALDDMADDEIGF